MYCLWGKMEWKAKQGKKVLTCRMKKLGHKDTKVSFLRNEKKLLKTTCCGKWKISEANNWWLGAFVA